MKYYETEFTITGPVELIQDARDLLAAMSGEVGYESFEDTTTGLKGYIQQDLYEENAIAEIIAEFPFENIKVDFTTSEAEYRDWNEQWENEGFMPIYITDDCVVHDGRHLPEYPAMTMVRLTRNWHSVRVLTRLPRWWQDNLSTRIPRESVFSTADAEQEYWVS